MKAIVDGAVIADSEDVIECKGYQYFPALSVRRDWLEKTAKSAADHVGGRFGFWQDVEVV